MADPIRIELDDPEHAESLRRELRNFHAEVVQIDGGWQVEVALIAANPELLVVQTLNIVDAWLLSAHVAAVRVHLDGQSYSLSAPCQGARSPRA